MQFSEKFLYHIWDAQHLVKNLKTISSKSLKILFTGRWNTDAGPDFKDVIIEIDGNVLRGDVEIDLQTYNWNSHNHNENPNFNSVILEVVYQHNGKYPYIINENGDQIEILELCNVLDKDVAKLLKKYSEKEFKAGRQKCKFFLQQNENELSVKLEEMGQERLEKKIKRFSAEHYFAGFDQLLLQGLLEALGYSKNKYQMLQLALKFRYNKLKKYYSNDMSQDELIALLLCSSDLINHLPSTFPAEFKTKWQELYSKQQFSKKKIDINWQLFRIRPVNHPAIRLLQISDFLYNSLETSLFHQILKLFSFSSGSFNLKDFTTKLYQVLQTRSEFLPERYKLGKTRIDTILVNIILPLVIVYAREKKYEKLEQAALKVYREFHGLPENYITQYMHNLMKPEQKKLTRKKAIYQQGLLKLYFDNCQYHDCEACETF